MSAHTPAVFDWLLTTFCFQGISDRVARDYMEKHGTASWSEIEASLRASPSCPKLRSYWHYEGCRYDKGSFTCSEPDHIDACPVPRPRLRNGRLNQTAYSLFLFVRDLAGGDLIGWIDGQLKAAVGAIFERLGGSQTGSPDRPSPPRLRRVRQGPDDGAFDLADRRCATSGRFGSRPAKP